MVVCMCVFCACVVGAQCGTQEFTIVSGPDSPGLQIVD